MFSSLICLGSPLFFVEITDLAKSVVIQNSIRSFDWGSMAIGRRLKFRKPLHDCSRQQISCKGVSNGNKPISLYLNSNLAPGVRKETHQLAGPSNESIWSPEGAHGQFQFESPWVRFLVFLRGLRANSTGIYGRHTKVKEKITHSINFLLFKLQFTTVQTPATCQWYVN